MLKIKNKIIGDQWPVYIIAEIGINHNGSLKLCKKMITEAKKSGADAVKLQISNPKYSYCSNTNSFKVFIIVSSISGIILTSFTEIPIEFNHLAITLVLVSTVLPERTSLPIIIIPAFVSFLLIIYKYK